jgi:alpha-galactosidase
MLLKEFTLRIHHLWVIMQPKRDTYYYRNQLVLDISNPKVQDYVFGIVDRIMTENPDVAYFKWDCNSVITNIYSPYHKENQGNFYIDHVRGIYKVLTRIHKKYPKLPMMLCSGGGGRMDYEMLKYFTEFWCSDDTDPYERLYIQWSLSKFFPAKTMGSHVTNWNKNTSVKFRTDVCSSCKLGFDIDLKSLSGVVQNDVPDELHKKGILHQRTPEAIRIEALRTGMGDGTQTPQGDGQPGCKVYTGRDDRTG